MKNNYLSPINIWITEVDKDFQNQVDEQVYKEVLNVGVSVDKKELIKALKYDRDQYNKGFKDGVESIIDNLREVIARY